MQKKRRAISISIFLAGAAYALQAAAEPPFLLVRDIHPGYGAEVTEHSVALVRMTMHSQPDAPPRNMAYEIGMRGDNGSHSLTQGVIDAVIDMKVGGEREARIFVDSSYLEEVDLQLVDVASTVGQLAGRNEDFTLAHTPKRMETATAPSHDKAPVRPMHEIAPADPDSFSNLPPATREPSHAAISREPYTPPPPDDSDSFVQRYDPQPAVTAPPPPPPSQDAQRAEPEPFSGGPSLRPEFSSPAPQPENTQEFYNRGGSSEFFNHGGESEFHTDGGTTEFYGRNANTDFSTQGNPSSE